MIQHGPKPIEAPAYRPLSHSPVPDRYPDHISNQDLIDAEDIQDVGGYLGFKLPGGKCIVATPTLAKRRQRLLEQRAPNGQIDYAAEAQDRHVRRTAKVLMLEIKDEHRQAEDTLRQIDALKRMVAAKEKTIIDLHERQAESTQLEDIVERAGLGMQLAAAGRIAESEAEDAKAALVQAKAKLKAQGDHLRALALDYLQRSRWDYQDRVIAAAQSAIKQACGSTAEPSDMTHIVSRIGTIQSLGKDIRLFDQSSPQSWGSTVQELEKLITG